MASSKPRFELVAGPGGALDDFLLEVDVVNERRITCDDQGRATLEIVNCRGRVRLVAELLHLWRLLVDVADIANQVCLDGVDDRFRALNWRLATLEREKLEAREDTLRQCRATDDGHSVIDGLRAYFALEYDVAENEFDTAVHTIREREANERGYRLAPEAQLVDPVA